jgi:hypothetical protein
MILFKFQNIIFIEIPLTWVFLSSRSHAWPQIKLVDFFFLGVGVHSNARNGIVRIANQTSENIIYNYNKHT